MGNYLCWVIKDNGQDGPRIEYYGGIIRGHLFTLEPIVILSNSTFHWIVGGLILFNQLIDLIVILFYYVRRSWSSWDSRYIQWSKRWKSDSCIYETVRIELFLHLIEHHNSREIFRSSVIMLQTRILQKQSSYC